ncbi:MAG: phage tail tip lysozyme [Candidatus Microsaccharimonas sp.]
MKLKYNYIKKAQYWLFIVVAAFSSLTFSSSASAETKVCDVPYYSTNDVLFYNACDDGAQTSCTTGIGTLDSPAPNTLSGESNPEKVWNYFIVRGLTPIAAAGAMGNMEQESSLFDPWAGEHSSTGNLDKGKLNTGFGIIQWTNTGGDTTGRRYGVMKYLEDNGVKLDASDPSQNDNALLYELNYLWDVEYGEKTWQEQVNAETKIEGDPSISYNDDNTGNGSAMVFHKLVERSGDSTKGKQERIDSAKGFLERFGNSGGAGSDCSIGQGGLTLQQAQKLMTYYKDIDTTATSFVSDVTCAGETARERTLANCVAFSQYFTNKFTSYQGVSGSGIDIVTLMAAANSGGKTGKEPQPFSVFSRSDESTEKGHTGIVLGIHDGKAVLGEASCGLGNAGIRAYEVPLESIKNDPRNFNFFYLGNKLDSSKLRDAAGVS